MANCKTYQGSNSKSYIPLALILVYTIQQPTVRVWTKFQLYSFRSSWEICNDLFSFMANCKTYQKDLIQELWALDPDSGKHNI